MPRFRLKSAELAADRIGSEQKIQTLNGLVVAHPGDWRVLSARGETVVFPDAFFQELFEPVDERAERALAAADDPNKRAPDPTKPDDQSGLPERRKTVDDMNPVPAPTFQGREVPRPGTDPDVQAGENADPSPMEPSNR